MNKLITTMLISAMAISVSSAATYRIVAVSSGSNISIQEQEAQTYETSIYRGGAITMSFPVMFTASEASWVFDITLGGDGLSSPITESLQPFNDSDMYSSAADFAAAISNSISSNPELSDKISVSVFNGNQLQFNSINEYATNGMVIQSIDDVAGVLTQINYLNIDDATATVDEPEPTYSSLKSNISLDSIDNEPFGDVDGGMAISFDFTIGTNTASIDMTIPMGGYPTYADYATQLENHIDTALAGDYVNVILDSSDNTLTVSAGPDAGTGPIDIEFIDYQWAPLSIDIHSVGLANSSTPAPTYTAE